MTHRTGTSLVEVLVAIFVMAIGLLALLTLFPLGALSMAQAIKDGRTAQAAANAAALAEAWGIRNDSLLVPQGGTDVFLNPNPTNALLLPLADPDGPSYPVYVDPVGTQSYLLLEFRTWVGGQPGIPRRSLSFVEPPLTEIPKRTLRWFTLLDDITFDKAGLPAAPGGEVQREGSYSWAYLLRRPRSSVLSVVDLIVVVYSKRPLGLTPSFLPTGETAYDATGTAGTNLVILTPKAGQEKPAVRKGEWILDATRELEKPVVHGPVHGYFYRVVGVSELENNAVELELQTNLRANLTQTTPTGARPGTVVVMEGVAEIFEKGPGTTP